MTDGTSDHAQQSSRRRLVCHSCGRVIRCTEADLLRYVRSGWPHCCGETMTLSSEPLGEIKKTERK